MPTVLFADGAAPGPGAARDPSVNKIRGGKSINLQSVTSRKLKGQGADLQISAGEN